ncbi:pyridoxamine 5'-phosphate oxidase family protein [Streptomyces sp. NPDC015346]|uniref:pyridoxamine 5'-phosphate oxidase family protein n=1 Tax=Streptomyces sp. NPDC015346 TaxID=3364954 RepID=UPI003702649A
MSTEETGTEAVAADAIQLLSRVPYGRVATIMRAMPFVAPARHIVDDGRVLLRMHQGFGYHRACAGGVVAYGADNLNSGAAHLWSVQFTGTAEAVEPTDAQLAAFGPAPRLVDGEPFAPVYLRVEPRFTTVHALDSATPPSTPQPHPYPESDISTT